MVILHVSLWILLVAQLAQTKQARLCEKFASLPCPKAEVLSVPDLMTMPDGKTKNNTEDALENEQKIPKKNESVTLTEENVENEQKIPKENENITLTEYDENVETNDTKDKQILSTEEGTSQTQKFWVMTLFACAICIAISVISTITTISCWQAARRSDAQVVETTLTERRDMRPRMETPSPPPFPVPSPRAARKVNFYEPYEPEPTIEEIVYIDIAAVQAMLKECKTVTKPPMN